MKPDWKDAPDWANYLAMDRDRIWCWHDVEPKWDEFRGVWVGRMVLLANAKAVTASNTLEARP